MLSCFFWYFFFADGFFADEVEDVTDVEFSSSESTKKSSSRYDGLSYFSVSQSSLSFCRKLGDANRSSRSPSSSSKMFSRVGGIIPPKRQLDETTLSTFCFVVNFFRCSFLESGPGFEGVSSSSESIVTTSASANLSSWPNVIKLFTAVIYEWS